MKILQKIFILLLVPWLPVAFSILFIFESLLNEGLFDLAAR